MTLFTSRDNCLYYVGLNDLNLKTTWFKLVVLFTWCFFTTLT